MTKNREMRPALEPDQVRRTGFLPVLILGKQAYGYGVRVQCPDGMKVVTAESVIKPAAGDYLRAVVPYVGEESITNTISNAVELGNGSGLFASRFSYKRECIEITTSTAGVNADSIREQISKAAPRSFTSLITGKEYITEFTLDSDNCILYAIGDDEYCIPGSSFIDSDGGLFVAHTSYPIQGELRAKVRNLGIDGKYLGGIVIHITKVSMDVICCNDMD